MAYRWEGRSWVSVREGVEVGMGLQVGLKQAQTRRKKAAPFILGPSFPETYCSLSDW